MMKAVEALPDSYWNLRGLGVLTLIDKVSIK